jgi:hypothetical protein
MNVAKQTAAEFMDDGSPSGPDQWRTVSIEEIEELVQAVLSVNDDVVAALKDLRINANRLCDRQLGGTYEDDCRRSIARADAALSHAHGEAC